MRAAEVELELVLLADTSSSIRGTEFDLQVQGYAGAFRDPEVIEAILNLGGNGIAVTFVQWSAHFQQLDSVGWTHLRTAADSRAFADAIHSQARRFQGFGTATGNAMEYGGEILQKNSFDSARQILDISSDERSNQGPHPMNIRRKLLAQGITINSLAILDDHFDMLGYFRNYVIGGPDAFVIAVEGYDDFAEAIKLKLVREISGQPVAGMTKSRPTLANLFQYQTAPLPQIARAHQPESSRFVRLQDRLALTR